MTKRAKTRVSQEVLRNLLHLPEDAVVTRIAYDPLVDQFIVYMYGSEQFQDVLECAPSPDFDIVIYNKES